MKHRHRPDVSSHLRPLGFHLAGSDRAGRELWRFSSVFATVMLQEADDSDGQRYFRVWDDDAQLLVALPTIAQAKGFVRGYVTRVCGDAAYDASLEEPGWAVV